MRSLILPDWSPPDDDDDDCDDCVNGADNIRFDYVCEGFLCGIGSGDFHIEQECDHALQVGLG